MMNASNSEAVRVVTKTMYHTYAFYNTVYQFAYKYESLSFILMYNGEKYIERKESKEYRKKVMRI